MTGSPPGNGARVYVVDDNPDVCHAFSALLSALGWPSCAFESAEACLAALQPAVACIVSDLEMPGLDGVDLIEALRTRGCATPVVLVTGKPAGAPGWQRARSAGAAAILQKPCGERELLRAVVSAVEAAPAP